MFGAIILNGRGQVDTFINMRRTVCRTRRCLAVESAVQLTASQALANVCTFFHSCSQLQPFMMLQVGMQNFFIRI